MTVNKRASLDGIDSPQPYNLIETDSGFEQQIIIIKKHRKKKIGEHNEFWRLLSEYGFIVFFLTWAFRVCCDTRQLLRLGLLCTKRTPSSTSCTTRPRTRIRNKNTNTHDKKKGVYKPLFSRETAMNNVTTVVLMSTRIITFFFLLFFCFLFHGCW